MLLRLYILSPAAAYADEHRASLRNHATVPLGTQFAGADALVFPEGDGDHALEVDRDKNLVRAWLGYIPSHLKRESALRNLTIRVPDFAARFIHETGF